MFHLLLPTLLIYSRDIGAWEVRCYQWSPNVSLRFRSGSLGLTEKEGKRVKSCRRQINSSPSSRRMDFNLLQIQIFSDLFVSASLAFLGSWRAKEMDWNQQQQDAKIFGRQKYSNFAAKVASQHIQYSLASMIAVIGSSFYKIFSFCFLSFFFIDILKEGDRVSAIFYNFLQKVWHISKFCLKINKKLGKLANFVVKWFFFFP